MKILLCCCAGMSTSILMMKMKKAARQQGKDYEFSAIGTERLETMIAEFDVLLLGPQTSKIVGDPDELQKKYEKPVYVVSYDEYGLGKGDIVLEKIEKLLGI